MHITVVPLWRHRRTTICNRATEMRLQWRDVEMEDRSEVMEFSLYGREGGYLV